MPNTNESNAIIYDVIISAVRTREGRQLAISAGAAASDLNVYVKHADGLELQQWERRVVRSDGAFVLINKQRPDKCIARKGVNNGSPLILVDILEIPKNPLCLWRNEGDLRGNHPINSGVDWEQKINIPGNGPYRDGDKLITWEWSRGQPNEMWRQLNGAFNLAAGFDTKAANTLSSAIYSGVYPKVFKGSIAVGKLAIKSVAYDILAAPVFSLRASPRLKDMLQNRVCDQFGAEQMERALFEASKASFEGDFPKVSFTIELEGGQKFGPIPGDVHAIATAEVQADHSFALRLMDGFLRIPGIPDNILQALNKAFVPMLIAYLNQSVLDPIKIPDVSFNGVALSTPEVTTQSNAMIAFSALQPSPVVVPPPSAWPSGVAFVAADTAALNAVATAALSTIKPGGRWGWTCDIGLCDLKLEAKYELGLGPVSFRLQPGSKDRIVGRVNFSGGASFSAKCGILSGSFGGSISGSGEVSGRVYARGDKVHVVFESLRDINVSIRLDGVPGFIAPVVNLLLQAFSPVIANTVNSYLGGRDFEIYTIPQIHFSIAGIPFSVKLKNLELNTISGPGSTPMLTVTGLADVRSPSYRFGVAATAPGSNSAEQPDSINLVIEEVGV